MGTKLNACKEVRKEIREIEKELDKAIFLSKELKDGKKEIGGLIITKSEEIKPCVESLLGKLELIDMELEKDSTVRDYYNCVYERLVDFLKVLAEIKSQ
ncbi:MAG: hypothetical protein NC433_09775 [Clostridiales bacterium]|nr:hypothetical protein [Clostridiales bacterium]